jgi:hypothetical protein
MAERGIELSPKMTPGELRAAALSAIGELQRERGRLAALVRTQQQIIERLNGENGAKGNLIVELRARVEDLAGALRNGEGGEQLPAELAAWENFGLRVATDMLALLEGLRGIRGEAKPQITQRGKVAAESDTEEGPALTIGEQVMQAVKEATARTRCTEVIRRSPDKKVCSVEWCVEPASSRGLCTTHYERWRRHSDPLLSNRSADGKRKANVHDCVLMREGPEGVWNPVKKGEGA